MSCIRKDNQDRPSRRIAEPETKKLYALSGNQCAFPGCEQRLVEFSYQPAEGSANVGKMAHIVAHSTAGPRGDAAYPVEKLNTAENLILLCATCHDRVDAFPCQFNVRVLRQMKLDHEAQFVDRPETKRAPEPVLEDRIFASVLPIRNIPLHVYRAHTDYRRDTMRTLWENVDFPANRSVFVTCALRDKHLYAFHDLSRTDGPFAKVCDPASAQRLLADEMWHNPDDHRLYVSLLNRALDSHLRSLGIKYHRKHRRYYYLANKETTTRSIPYRTPTNRRETRNVVWNPITRVTGEGKRYWVHLASRLTFQMPGPGCWMLTVRPERFLTKDGYNEFDTDIIGRKVTRLKATMHNRAYLAEVRLWSQVLTCDKPRISLCFDKQWLTIENTMLESSIEWRGVPGDDQDVADLQPEDDLFTWAEAAQISDDIDEEDEGGAGDELEE